MLYRELTVEVEPKCISLWKEPWAKRSARVTLLVEPDDKTAIVMDPFTGFGFLPGGGMEEKESVEDAAKREAVEELGIEIKINQIIATFHVTLVSRKTGEQLQIHPFIVVYATHVAGQFKTEYAPKRKILLLRREECESLLRNCQFSEEYECMKPYYYISKEIIREFSKHSTHVT